MTRANDLSNFNVSEKQEEVNMELTVKLDRQDIASENLLGLIRSLQSIAREEAPKAEPVKEAAPEAESVKEAAPKKDKASKKEAPKAEPVKEEVKKAEPVKEEAPKVEPVKEEAPKVEPVKEGAPKAEPAKEEPPKAKVIDLSEMKKRVMAIKDADNDKWDGIKNLIKQYGGGKLSAIPEDTREDFMAAVEAL
jgi:outer membrane biosynthesis protein TonB